MATQPHHGIIPTWTVGDRLRKARVMSNQTVAEFARQALCPEKTVNNYEADKVKHRPLLIEKWADVTGVDIEWIKTGEAPVQPEPDEGLPILRARRYSKPQPSDPNVRPLRSVA